MAELVVLLSLFRIAENVVGLLDLAEPLCGVCFLVDVRVEFSRQLSMRGTDFVLARGTRDAQDIVIVTFSSHRDAKYTKGGVPRGLLLATGTHLHRL